MATKVIFSNYHWEKDEHGKSHYDYARELLFVEDEEHRFADTDYYDADQLCIEGLETYTCPICGNTFTSLVDAKQCCRDDKWETEDDIPDNIVSNFVYNDECWEWDGVVADLKYLIKKSPHGFVLYGSIGRWNGTVPGAWIIKEFDDLYDCWQDCDYIKIYDEDGHLYIECSHHDGNNKYELKELTAAGADFEGDFDRLWNDDNYTQPAYFAHKVWGCEKE